MSDDYQMREVYIEPGYMIRNFSLYGRKDENVLEDVMDFINASIDEIYSRSCIYPSGMTISYIQYKYLCKNHIPKGGKQTLMEFIENNNLYTMLTGKRFEVSYLPYTAKAHTYFVLFNCNKR